MRKDRQPSSGCSPEDRRVKGQNFLLSLIQIALDRLQNRSHNTAAACGPTHGRSRSTQCLAVSRAPTAGRTKFCRRQHVIDNHQHIKPKQDVHYTNLCLLTMVESHLAFEPNVAGHSHILAQVREKEVYATIVALAIEHMRYIAPHGRRKPRIHLNCCTRIQSKTRGTIHSS
jgi:hypothetical protein